MEIGLHFLMFSASARFLHNRVMYPKENDSGNVFSLKEEFIMIKNAFRKKYQRIFL